MIPSVRTWTLKALKLGLNIEIEGKKKAPLEVLPHLNLFKGSLWRPDMQGREKERERREKREERGRDREGGNVLLCLNDSTQGWKFETQQHQQHTKSGLLAPTYTYNPII